MKENNIKKIIMIPKYIVVLKKDLFKVLNLTMHSKYGMALIKTH